MTYATASKLSTMQLLCLLADAHYNANHLHYKGAYEAAMGDMRRKYPTKRARIRALVDAGLCEPPPARKRWAKS